MKNLNIYLVGGAIRDKLLHLCVKEQDWVVLGSDIKSMLNLKFKMVGKDFPVFLHPINKEEYVLARMINKNYSKFKYNFSILISLKDDLFCRDLNINAIALNKYGNLIDPFHGIINLKNKRLTCISYSFSEDPLRILRLIRFSIRYSNLGFYITLCTSFLIRDLIFKCEITYIPSERILKEMYLSFRSHDAYVFFDLLYNWRVLKVLFFDLYILCILSNIYKFNICTNIWKQLCKILIVICEYSNNFFLKVAIFFLKLDFKDSIFKKQLHFASYKNNMNSVFDYYRLVFHFSKKYYKFIKFLFIFNYFYRKNFFERDSCIFIVLNKINALNDKIKFLNILLICNIDFHMNCYINKFYEKYIILDILDEINKLYNRLNKLNLFNKKKYVNKFLYIIKKRKYIYSKLYF